jgi:hypothetical protein
MTVNTQQVASIFRQVIAVAALVMGPLTASLSAIHLPTAVSAVLSVLGVLILAIEHYVSDPSTGTPTVPVTTAQGVVQVPVAPVPVPPTPPVA